jgi:hypothetical protein
VGRLGGEVEVEGEVVVRYWRRGLGEAGGIGVGVLVCEEGVALVVALEYSFEVRR